MLPFASSLRSTYKRHSPHCLLNLLARLSLDIVQLDEELGAQVGELD